MLNNLLGVLLRFRERAVAMVGDIGKLFHAIDIPIVDQMTHRFLWRDLEDEREPDTYVMTSVNVGDRPSGTIAMIVLRKTAEMSKSEFPQACQTIISNSYMDDIMDSVDLVDEARKVMGEIDEVLDKGVSRSKSGHAREEHEDVQQTRTLNRRLFSCSPTQALRPIVPKEYLEWGGIHRRTHSATK